MIHVVMAMVKSGDAIQIFPLICLDHVFGTVSVKVLSLRFIENDNDNNDDDDDDDRI